MPPSKKDAADMTWREFWNTDTPIYVNARHKAVHYAAVAADIRALIGSGRPRVVDYASGEALSADVVAEASAHLYLVDGAELVRDRLAERFGHLDTVTVLAPEEMDQIAGGSIDLIVVNSLLQYLNRADLVALLAEWRRILKPQGRLLIADVIPPGVGPITDAGALLRFGWRQGFASAALAGLVRTAFSDYRRQRARLGLSVYAEADMRAILAAAGFIAQRHYPNLGHNQARMAFMARPDAG